MSRERSSRKSSNTRRRTRRTVKDRLGKPTIADVAAVAEVSVATVSYVINGRTNEVSPATADRVRDAVRELGYVRNLAAAALTGKKSRLIAVIVPEAGKRTEGSDINPFYGEFVFRFEQQARKYGYGLCVHGGTEEEYIQFLLERGVESAVLVGVPERAFPESLVRNDVHCVLYDSFDHNRVHSLVRTNEVKGGYLAAERLIDIGKKHIVFAGDVDPNRKNDVMAMRYEGAVKACEMAGLNPPRLFPLQTSYDDGLRAAEEIANSGADGVVVPADILAAGLIEGLQNLGRNVPAHLAVVGYDNLQMSRFVRPRLTTIDQGLQEKVEALMQIIHNRNVGDIRIIDPRIVVRESA